MGFGYTDPYQTPVLFAGDSIMAGTGGFGAGAWEAVADYVRDLPRLSQYNVAVGGSKLASGANNCNTQLTTALAGAQSDATSVVVISGLNNALDDDSLATMQTEAQTVMTTVEGYGLPLMMCAIMPFRDSTGWTQARQDVAVAFNKWLAQECVARGHDYADAWRTMAEADDQDYTRDGWRADNTHLNSAGCTYYGDMIARVADRRRDKQVQVHG